MNLLAVTVAVVGAVGVVNLIFTYGVVRRLRQHDQLLSQRRGAGPADDTDEMLPTGSVVGDFTAVADDGAVVQPTTFAADTLVGFFAPGCAPCADLLPSFVDAARERGAAGRPVAVIAEGAEEQDYRDRLGPVATVVGGPEGRKIISAFNVIAYPAICTVNADGVITARGLTLVSADRRVAA